MEVPCGKHNVAINQPGFPGHVQLNAEFNAERNGANEVDLGRNSELASQQSGDVAPKSDSGQATNVAVDDHHAIIRQAICPYALDHRSSLGTR